MDLGAMAMKGVTLHSSESKNWNLTTGCSLVSYQEKPFSVCSSGRVLPLCREYSQHILSPTDKANEDIRIIH